MATHQEKPALPPARILVVDDNVEAVDILTHLLKRSGLTVFSAYNGDECLEIVRTQPIDVVILDVMMPKKDGLAVCEELQQISPALPVILLTARDDMQTRARGMALGVSEFVVKPINTSDLLARVQTQIDTREWEREIDQTSATIKNPAQENSAPSAVMKDENCS